MNSLILDSDSNDSHLQKKAKYFNWTNRFKLWVEKYQLPLFWGDIALRRVDATAAQVAGLLVATMDGVKHRQGGGEALRQGMALHIRLLGAALLRM